MIGSVVEPAAMASKEARRIAFKEQMVAYTQWSKEFTVTGMGGIFCQGMDRVTAYGFLRGS